MSLDYKKAGVDIEKGDSLVQWLKTEGTGLGPHSDRLVSGIGGFAALFRADFQQMERPLLVSSTDGVGTKLKVAFEFERYEGLGQDLVAMCVNDLICCGAEPLFFLDYYACGKLELEIAKSFLAGLKRACDKAECALIGGETAEMPGMYQGKEFDCAGFAVGVVDEKLALGSHKVEAGHRLVALPSSGFHSNGYSLLRKVFAEDLAQWKDLLLTPTELYVSPVKQLLKNVSVKAIAHITGGGVDNLARVLPDGLQIQLNPWKLPKAFLEVKTRAEMSWESLLQTLNCGVGLGVIVPESDLEKTIFHLKNMGIAAFEWGAIEAGEGQVVWSAEEMDLVNA